MRSLQLAGAIAALTLAITSAAHAQEDRTDWLDIEFGKSVVIETPRTPVAIAVTDPNVANPVPLGVGNRIQIQGLSIGTTDLVVQYGGGHPPITYEITVNRDMSDLIRRIDSIVEGEPPRAYPLDDRIVIEGEVDDLDTLEQVALVARLYDADFVNLMTVRGDHQVQLEVLFAEVSRTGLRELGLNALWGNSNIAANLQGPTAGANNVWANPSVGNLLANGGLAPAPGIGGFTIGTWINPLNLAGVIQLLDDYKLGKILAQPTLLSLSGQQAQFLAGGEIPIPSPMPGGGGVRIEFKEYGIQLVFVPTVLANNIIDVQVLVEVSELDYGSASRITGIEVPGFLTRRTKTHLRIEDGMTFAVAGMLSDSTNFSRVGIPGLGRLPIVGALFRAVQHSRDETEVVIYVTPRLVRPLAPGEVPAAPGTTENNNPSDIELFLLGMDHRPGSRTASPTGAVGLQR